MASIFEKGPVLKPSQLVTVAERRFGDAQALCDTGKNVHANGVEYLAGFVVEMLLKAQLMRRYPRVALMRVQPAAATDRELWSLIYRSHDLDEMLNRLPELELAVRKKAERSDRPYHVYLRSICSVWTIFARYSPSSVGMTEASEFLDRVRLLKEILK